MVLLARRSSVRPALRPHCGLIHPRSVQIRSRPISLHSKRDSDFSKSPPWLIPPRLIQYGKNNRSAFWHGRGKHMMSLFYHSPQYLFTERFEQALFLYRGIIERLQQLILLTASYRFDFPLALVFAQKFGEGFFPTGFITSSAVMSPICSRRRA